MADNPPRFSRRRALQCMAYGGAGTLFALSGGVLAPIDLAVAATRRDADPALGKPLFVQISDTHIGFHKDANPDVNGTLTSTIDLVNGMREQPALILHTGDITHLSKPEEFDLAQQMLGRLAHHRVAYGAGRARRRRCHRDRVLQSLRPGLQTTRATTASTMPVCTSWHSSTCCRPRTGVRGSSATTSSPG